MCLAGKWQQAKCHKNKHINTEGKFLHLYFCY
jgi:hypothetical protein